VGEAETLFSELESPVQTSEGSELVYLTNRSNLREILSSAAVAPKQAFDKYYRDLLEPANGRLVLIRAPIHPSLAAFVAEEGTNNFPVLLVLDEEKLTLSAAPALEDSAWAPTGLIGLRAVVSVYFRTDEDLREHRAREYDNVRSDVPMEVRPACFESGSLHLERLLDWLGQLPPAETPTGEALREADKIAGARALAVAAAPSDRLVLKSLAAVLAGPSRAKTTPPKKPDPGLSVPWLYAELAGRDAAAKAAPAESDALVYAAALSAFAAADPAKTSPLSIIDEIESTVRDGEGFGDEERGRLARAFEAMRALLRNERQFEGFRSSDGDVALQAVLAVVLRPDPKRLLSWDMADLGASNDVRTAAAGLVGMMFGRRLLPVSMRTRVLDQLLSEEMAAELTSPEAASRPERPKLRVREDKRTGRLEIMWGRETVVEKAPVHQSVVERIKRGRLPASALAAASLELCRLMGWEDSVLTELAGKGAVIDEASGQIRVRMEGFPTLDHHVDRKQLESRLANEEVPPSVEEALERFVHEGASSEKVQSARAGVGD
jgi:hypothetical protein